MKLTKKEIKEGIKVFVWIVIMQLIGNFVGVIVSLGEMLEFNKYSPIMWIGFVIYNIILIVTGIRIALIKN
jgi:hypothetical protein